MNTKFPGETGSMTQLKSILLAGTIAMLPLGAQAHAAPKEAPVAEVVAAPVEDGTATSPDRRQQKRHRCK